MIYDLACMNIRFRLVMSSLTLVFMSLSPEVLFSDGIFSTPVVFKSSSETVRILVKSLVNLNGVVSQVLRSSEVHAVSESSLSGTLTITVTLLYDRRSSIL